MTTRAVEATGLPAEDPRVPVRGDRSQQTPSAPVPEVPGPDSTTPGDAAGGVAIPDPGAAATPPAVEAPAPDAAAPVVPVAEAPGPVADAPGPVAEAPGPVAQTPGPVADAPAPAVAPTPVPAAAPQVIAVPPGIPVPPAPPAAAPPAAEAAPAPTDVPAPTPLAPSAEVPAPAAAVDPAASTARTTTTSAPRLTPATPPVKTAAKAPAKTATTTAATPAAGATKAPVARSGGAGSGSGTGSGDGTGATPRQPRRQNPEARMALREHLRELRKRVVRAGIAIVLGAIAGWFLYKPVFNYLTEPLAELAASGKAVSINFGTVAGAFDLQLKMSVWIGFIISSPIWIYQLWAFVTPGLTKKERRYALGFMSAAVPLFLAGVFLASLFIPNAVTFFTSFTPDDGSNIIPAADYLGFIMRTVLAFGLAFLMPVVLVGLNFTGLLSGKAVLKSWRWVLVLCMTFAAIATPTPDVTAMFTLAAPMLVLFGVAIVICLFNDRRRARRNPQFGEVGDDEASDLADDEASGPIGRAAPLAERPAPVDDESTAR